MKLQSMTIETSGWQDQIWFNVIKLISFWLPDSLHDLEKLLLEQIRFDLLTNTRNYKMIELEGGIDVF